MSRAINQFKGSKPRCRRSSRAATASTFGYCGAQGACPWRWSTARCAGASWARMIEGAPAQDEEFVLSHADNVQATGFRRAPEAAALRRLPVGAGAGAGHAPGDRRRPGACGGDGGSGGVVREAQAKHGGASEASTERPTPATTSPTWTKQTKRMIRRAILKAVGDPGLSGALRQPRDAHALRLGHRRRTGDRRAVSAAEDRAQGHRPGRGRHHQCRLDPRSSSEKHGRRCADDRAPPRRPRIIQTRHRIPGDGR